MNIYNVFTVPTFNVGPYVINVTSSELSNFMFASVTKKSESFLRGRHFKSDFCFHLEIRFSSLTYDLCKSRYYYTYKIVNTIF